MVRLLAVKKGVVIAAKMPGKIKTVLYIFVGATCLGLKMLQVFSFGDDILKALYLFNTVLYCMAAFFSVFSFLIYLKDYKKIVE